MVDRANVEKAAIFWEFEHSSCYAWIEKISNYLQTRTIFEMNWNETKRALLSYERLGQIDLLEKTAEDKMVNAELEVFRCIHNYLASVGSIRDYGRILVNQLKAEGKEVLGYDDKISELFNSPIAHFIQQLRNYVLHKEWFLVYPYKGFYVYEKEETAKTLLYLKKLREWDKWSPKSLEFINSSIDRLSIREILEEYSIIVENFNQWFLHEIMSALEDEFRVMESLAKRLEQIPHN